MQTQTLTRRGCTAAQGPPYVCLGYFFLSFFLFYPYLFIQFWWGRRKEKKRGARAADMLSRHQHQDAWLSHLEGVKTWLTWHFQSTYLGEKFSIPFFSFFFFFLTEEKKNESTISDVAFLFVLCLFYLFSSSSPITWKRSFFSPHFFPLVLFQGVE